MGNRDRNICKTTTIRNFQQLNNPLDSEDPKLNGVCGFPLNAIQFTAALRPAERVVVDYFPDLPFYMHDKKRTRINSLLQSPDFKIPFLEIITTFVTKKGTFALIKTLSF